MGSGYKAILAGLTSVQTKLARFSNSIFAGSRQRCRFTLSPFAYASFAFFSSCFGAAGRFATAGRRPDSRRFGGTHHYGHDHHDDDSCEAGFRCQQRGPRHHHIEYFQHDYYVADCHSSARPR